MQAKEVIILAGGSGSRIASLLPGVPKILAPIDSRSFIDILMQEYIGHGILHFIFSLGHLQEQVVKYLEDHYPEIRKTYVAESTPLGTGGALLQAMQHAESSYPLVVNGDTLFRIDVNALMDLHLGSEAYCTLALKPVDNTARYGAVVTDASARVISFQEKGSAGPGYINGGIYVVSRDHFLSSSHPEKFSFEMHLQASTKEKRIFGLTSPGYFIDIGIPEDYERAKQELGGHSSGT